jgi:hypothetical protein
MATVRRPDTSTDYHRLNQDWRPGLDLDSNVKGQLDATPFLEVLGSGESSLFKSSSYLQSVIITPALDSRIDARKMRVYLK